MRHVFWAIIAVVSLFSLLGAAIAKPELWMMPPPMNNGQEFRELFEAPGQWSRREHASMGWAMPTTGSIRSFQTQN